MEIITNNKINRNDLIHDEGVIYKIIEPESQIFYIGSSVDLYFRMANHKTKFNNKNSDAYYKPFYNKLRELNKKITNCIIENIEVFENISIRNLEKYENEYIKKYENDELNYNKNRAIRTKKEYYIENKEVKKEYANKKIICEICDIEYNTSNKSHHLRSKKHQKAIKNIELVHCHICNEQFKFIDYKNHYDSINHINKSKEIMEKLNF